MSKIVLTEDEYAAWADELICSPSYYTWSSLEEVLIESRGIEYSEKELKEVDFEPINHLTSYCDVCGNYVDMGSVNEYSECDECEEYNREMDEDEE